MLALFALDRERGAPAPPREELDAASLTPEDAAELERRRAIAPDDVTALLLVGLVRSGVHIAASHLRSLFWARPARRSRSSAPRPTSSSTTRTACCSTRRSRARDGFFTTFFVSPYSRYIARWAARRGLTPNQVTTVLDRCSACSPPSCFATGERWGLVAGAVLATFAFTLDCVDGQLARYTRQFSKLGAWLDSIFDRTKEYVVLRRAWRSARAAPATRSWLLAGAALTLQTMRHAIDFSYPASQHQVIADDAAAAARAPVRRAAAGVAADRAGRDRRGRGRGRRGAAARARAPDAQAARRAAVAARPTAAPTRWVKKIIAFPIGERFAAISITAALFDARADVHRAARLGRLRRRSTCCSAARCGRWRMSAAAIPSAAPAAVDRGSVLDVYRDDGPLARALGARSAAASRCRRSRCSSSPGSPLLVAIAIKGDGASTGLVGRRRRVGWCSLGGLAERRAR